MRISFLFRTVFNVIFVSVLSTNILSFSSSKLNSVYLVYAKKKSKNLSTSLINDAVSNSLCNVGTVVIEDKEISSYQIEKVNNIIVEVNNYILSRLEDNNFSTFQVPFSLIYSNPLISHLGPSIPAKMCLIGDVLSSSFYSVDSFGINNALVTLYVKVTLNIATYLPLVNENEEISVDVPISMNIIKGEIPSSMIGSYSL